MSKIKTIIFCLFFFVYAVTELWIVKEICVLIGTEQQVITSELLWSGSHTGQAKKKTEVR